MKTFIGTALKIMVGIIDINNSKLSHNHHSLKTLSVVAIIKYSPNSIIKKARIY